VAPDRIVTRPQAGKTRHVGRAPTIVNVGYRSTNYWVVSAGGPRLLVDLGWPGTLRTLRAQLERAGVPIGELRHGFATHYHIDHAGLAEELKGLGMRLWVLESQVAAIPLMKRHVKPRDEYVEITPHGNAVIGFAESRSRLADIGLGGEIVPTPGHSDDSVSLVLDDGSAFTGDLTPDALATPENAGTLAASWQRLRDLGMRAIYPGHGPIRTLREPLPVPDVSRMGYNPANFAHHIGTGPWTAGYQVSYGISFYDATTGRESEPAWWGPKTDPKQLYGGFGLVRIPVDPTGQATSRRVWRRFEGEDAKVIDEIPDNVTTKYQDGTL
jgi:ribonuclease/clavin/mitogillin